MNFKNSVSAMNTAALLAAVVLCAVLPACGSEIVLSSDAAPVEVLNDAIAATDSILTAIVQKDEIVPDSVYSRGVRLCRFEGSLPELTSVCSSADPVIRKRLVLRLNGAELYSLWGIDAYLKDTVKLHNARSLLNAAMLDLKQLGLWKEDPYFTGRSLYLDASLIMIESARLAGSLKFDELMPMLQEAEDSWGAVSPRGKIAVLHAKGRACSYFAFDDDITEERSFQLMRMAEDAFRQALTLSDGENGFMRVSLLVQLGNILSNMNRNGEAIDILRGVIEQLRVEDEPNRSLSVRLDIAQILTSRFLERRGVDDLIAARSIAEDAMRVSDGLTTAQALPQVRFNLAVTLFTLARESGDKKLNGRAIHEMEKVLSVWTFEAFPDFYLTGLNRMAAFIEFAVTDSTDPHVADSAIDLLETALAKTEVSGPLLSLAQEDVAGLYRHLASFYFRRALNSSGTEQQQSYDLSTKAERRALELEQTR